MKIGILASAVTFVSIMSGCAATPTLDFQPITTKEEYMTALVGRAISLGNKSSTTTHSDGTMTGTAGDREIIGTWSWEDGRFCREGTIGDQELKRDCQKMELAGDQLRITRGDGSVSIFDLK